MGLAKELVGSFIMGFFAALLAISLLLYFFLGELFFAVAAGVCAVSVALLYWLDFRAGPKIRVGIRGKAKMRYCYGCGSANLPQAENCYNCGARLD